MHVRISDKGRQVINNKELASRLVLAVVNNKSNLEKGETVKVNDSAIGVKLVTTIKEVNLTSTHQ